jgi:hypothetical protein
MYACVTHNLDLLFQPDLIHCFGMFISLLYLPRTALHAFATAERVPEAGHGAQQPLFRRQPSPRSQALSCRVNSHRGLEHRVPPVFPLVIYVWNDVLDRAALTAIFAYSMLDQY